MDQGSFIEYDMYLEHNCADFGMENQKVIITRLITKMYDCFQNVNYTVAIYFLRIYQKLLYVGVERHCTKPKHFIVSVCIHS